jgi:hypothetical protein
MSKIEAFAKETMGITLLPGQLTMIRAWAEGRVIHTPTAAGMTTARNVMSQYLLDGLKND